MHLPVRLIYLLWLFIGYARFVHGDMPLASQIIQEPIIFSKVWPRTTLSIGYDAGMDVQVDRESDNSFSTSIQEVFNYLQYIQDVKGMKGPFKVTIGEGVYISAMQIGVLTSNTEVKGMGVHSTFVMISANAPSWLNPNITRSPGLFKHILVDNIFFHDMTLDGNKKHQNKDGLYTFNKDGLFFMGSNNVTIQNMIISNFQESGILVQPNMYTRTFPSNIRITNSEINNNDENGIQLDFVSGGQITNNSLEGNEQGAFHFTQGTNHIIGESNRVSDGRCGLVTKVHGGNGTSLLIFSENTFENMKRAGACLEGSRNVTFSRNTVRSGLDCFDVANINDSLIVENNCIDLSRWSGKRKTRSFYDCNGCINTIIANNTLTNRGITTQFMPMQFLIVLGVVIAMAIAC